MSKKTIKIKFVDFWDGFNYKNCLIYEILNRHYNVEISDEPDYIICSVYNTNRGYSKDEFLEYDCIRIFFSGENEYFKSDLYDYGIDFNKYRDERHIQLPVYYFMCSNYPYVEMMKNKHLNNENILSKKDRFCSFVYTNSVKFRNKFFLMLNLFKKVDSAGRVLNNYEIGKSWQDKLSFESRHKFSIAFENSVSESYITEKLVQSFAATTVPIYYGAPDVSDYFNTDAMVLIKSEKEFLKTIFKVLILNLNDKEYLEKLNTPAIAPGKEELFDSYRIELEKFLLNIIEQPLDKARRRP